ncbi:MAG: hypothetical protein EA362_07680 [Saprospirales bacterium]|nr:MAG: hypothetical protein EA362_07680 [Saprospirales bacterium]
MVFALYLSVLSLNAQGSLSGNWLLGGGIGFEAEKNSITDSWDRTLEAYPLLVWFPISSLGFGMEVSYLNEKTSGSGRTLYTLRPLVRYYIYSGWFPQIQYVRGIEDPGFFKRDISGYVLGLGYTYPIRPNFGIEPLLTYNYIDGKRFFMLKINLVGSF